MSRCVTSASTPRVGDARSRSGGDVTPSLPRAFGPLPERSPAHRMAPALLITRLMSTALELLYEYRHLMGKCRSSAGLDMDEIQTLDAIEALFEGDGSRGSDSRGFTTVMRS